MELKCKVFKEVKFANLETIVNKWIEQTYALRIKGIGGHAPTMSIHSPQTFFHNMETVTHIIYYDFKYEK